MNENFFVGISEIVLETLKSLKAEGESLTAENFKNRAKQNKSFESLIKRTFSVGCMTDVVQSIIFMSEKVKHVIPEEVMKKVIYSLKNASKPEEVSEHIVEFISILVENLEKSTNSFDKIKNLILDISQKISNAAKLVDSSIKTSLDVIQEDVNSDKIIVSDLDSILKDSKDANSFEIFKNQIESRIETISQVIKAKIISKNEHIKNLEDTKIKASHVIDDMDSKDKQLESIKTELEIYKNQALKDFLTGLYNRKHFDQVINQEIEIFERYASLFSVVFMDIDDFKKINDEYGHIVGDFVLRHFSSIIRKNIRKIDIPFRYGGEEFLIILPNSSTVKAITVSERILEDIRKTVFKYRGIKISITVSMGIQEYSKGMSAENIVDLADQKMLKAKKDGKNRVVSEL